ncbi:MAG: Ig-like domain-containing protein, partial [Blastocatellia bacterium]|nr:Ig-like domain-containing protein [Blastocatellia bacterium]
MFTNRSSKVSQFLIIILALQLIAPTYLNAYSPNPNIIKKKTYQNLYKSTKKPLAVRYLKPLQQSSNIQLFGPNQDANPVVNENNQIQLTATDSSGNTLTDVTFESGSPDVASIDSQGMVSGKVQGYATVTARRGNESISIFVTVAKVDSTKGKQASGDTKVDSSGAIYISDPTNHIIFKRESADADAANFAGKMGSRGKTDGDALESLFAGPTAVAVDNRSQGGIYIADTLNHSVRRVDFNNKVTTILGTGAPGINTADVTPFSQAAFSSPQGIAVNSAGNLFVADTDNHA